MKNKNFKRNRLVNKRNILIEQCLIDAYCERTGKNPELIEEGWWDNVKAGAAGAWAGAKQGIKNIGDKASNAAKMTKNWFGRKKDQISNMAKNLGAAANNQSMTNGVNPRSVTQGISDPAKRVPASFAKNFAKIRSYAASAADVLSKFISIVEPTLQMTGEEGPIVDAKNLIEELKVLQDKNISVEEIYYALTDGAQSNQQQPQQGIDNAENIDQGDQQAELGSPYEDTPENEEQLNASYNPHINSHGQRLMLESFRRKY